MPTFAGEIKKANTKDDVQAMLTPGTYEYTLESSDGGKVRFKVEAHLKDYPHLGETGNHKIREYQTTIEDRSRIASEARLSGKFKVPQQGNASHSGSTPTTEVHFILSRGILTKGSAYKVTYNRVAS